MLACRRCGYENADDARFCSACGAPLALAAAAGPLREERKVVTVLFADLVGFTSRAEQMDPEDVRALLSPYYARLRAELERFGGTVEKFIGDAVMAVFGAPVAHEDDPERAVRAALAIRDWIVDEQAELQVRIGIATGEALVALDARPAEGEGIVSGDVVNTAARLQTAAPVDGILVGQYTFRATEHTIEYREADPVRAKGKAEPLPVWQALQARARPGLDVAHATRVPLVGRRRELDVLIDAFARARGTREPQLVTVVGVPGIGKTRLVAELAATLERGPDLVAWRQGRSLPYGETVSLGALAEMVKAQAGILETDAPAEAGGKLARALADLIPVEAEARWLEGHLRPLVGLGGRMHADGGRQEEAFAAWRRFVEGIAEEHPAVIVFEDLHWADDALLDFIDHLVEWTTGVPLLVVCTARPELLSRRPGWGGGKPNAQTTSLPPLSDAETARLIAALVDQPVLPADAQAALLARAGGNPLYAEEYARLVREGGGETDGGPPETVHGIIAARLDALPPDEKRLLQEAAVIGKVFWVGALSGEGRGRFDVEGLLHELTRKEFVRRERRSRVESETEYSFLHVLVREVAYGQIPRAARAQRHCQAAVWLESLGRREDHAEMLARHYSSALELLRAAGEDTAFLEGPARTALRDAGDRAARLNAFETAARYYGEALPFFPQEDPERAQLLLQRARAVFYGRRLEAVDELLALKRELLEAGERDGAGEVAAMVCWAEWDRGRRELAYEHLEEALELLEERPASRSKAFVLAEQSRVVTLSGTGDPVATARRALAVAEDAGLPDLQARALNTVGIARVFDGDLGGLADLERSIELATQAGSQTDIVRGYVNLSSVMLSIGDVRRAFEHHRAAVEAAERFDRATLRWLRAERVEFDYHFGEWDAALANADAFLAEVEAGEPHYLEDLVLHVRSLVRVARGDVEGALADDTRQLAAARRVRDPQALYQALAVSTYVLFQAGRPEEASSRADELLEIWRTDPLAVLYKPCELAFPLAALDRSDEFLAVAQSTPRASRWLEAARRVALRDYAAAAELFAQISARPLEAHARLSAAEQLAASGRTAEAEEQSRLALEFLRSVGARTNAQAGEASLAASSR